MSRIRGTQVNFGVGINLDDAQAHRDKALEAFLLEAQAKGQLIVAEAQARAAQLIEEAQAQAQAILEEAAGSKDEVLKEFYEQGVQEGYQQAEGDTLQLLEGAQRILEGAYEAEQRLLKSEQKRIANLVAYLVNKIIALDLSSHPDHLLSMIERATDSLKLSGRVRVVLSGETLHQIQQFAPTAQEYLERMDRFEFIVDPKLGLLDLFVLGHEGGYCISPSHQVDQLVEAVVKKLPQLTEAPSQEEAECATDLSDEDAPDLS